MFLVACTQLYNLLCPFVCRLVRQTLILIFSAFMSVYGCLLHYCSCPNTWLVFFITALAHQHLTKVAVYPDLFKLCATQHKTPLWPSIGWLVAWLVGWLGSWLVSWSVLKVCQCLWTHFCCYIGPKVEIDEKYWSLGKMRKIRKKK